MSERLGGMAFLGTADEAAVYGPTDGRLNVIAGAGPRLVTNPGGGIAFNSTYDQIDLHALIDANPTSSTFVGAAGTYSFTGPLTDRGRNPTIVFLPGTTINGTGYAATGIQATQFGTGTLRGGTWQNFSSGLTDDAARIGGATFEDITITAVWFSGLQIYGQNNTIRYCRMFSNGQNGLLASNFPGEGERTNNNISFNKIDDNNIRKQDTGIEGGGAKMLFQINQSVHHNYVNANYGNGLWWDTNCWNLLIEENVAENQFHDLPGGDAWQDGMVLEACSGGTTVRHNDLIDNGSTNGDLGFSQFAVSRCNATQNGTFPEIRITANRFDCADGREAQIGLFNSATKFCKGIQVLDNEFWLRHLTATSKVGSSTTTIGTPAENNNFFLGNKYRMADTSISAWHWNTAMFTPVSWASWQALGHDSDASGAVRTTI